MSTRFTRMQNGCPTTNMPTSPTPPYTMPHIHLAAATATTSQTKEAMSSFRTNNADVSCPASVKLHNLLHSTRTHAQKISWRLRRYCTQFIAANSRSRRRRGRRRDDINNNNNYSNIINCNINDCKQISSNNNNFTCNNSHTNVTRHIAVDNCDQKNNNENNNSSYTNINNSLSSSNLSKIIATTAISPAIQLLNATVYALSHPSTATTFIVAMIFVLSTLCSFCAASPCDLDSWWDPIKDKCILCTVCEGDLIPLRPCQLHRDTICGSIYDLKIDWVVLAKTEPNWKERRKEDANYELEQQLTHEELQQLQNGTLPMDWHTTALLMAVLACLFFFIIAAGILVYHMRQWRRMERRLDQDVEELSTKLMAKLAEVQSMDGGTFFIGNADALGVPTNFQPRHMLLPEKPAKHHERRILKTLQPGNVYIEENGSKG
ncbi:uncharacterized protein wgn [Eurosta solidaginis]|uniref:uncharacterized protein wgn n=1 Tax=Eurosta solidaginis TaxID=178769 RepID=UPI0035310775